MYASQRSAIEELASAIVRDRRRGRQWARSTTPSPSATSHWRKAGFSANSKADFSDNIRSIRNIYTGRFGTFGDGRSLSELVEGKDPTLDVQIRAEIEAAIDAITDIPGTFSDAVTEERPAVDRAQKAVRQLQATLASKLVPLVGGL